MATPKETLVRYIGRFEAAAELSSKSTLRIVAAFENAADDFKALGLELVRPSLQGVDAYIKIVEAQALFQKACADYVVDTVKLLPAITKVVKAARNSQRRLDFGVIMEAIAEHSAAKHVPDDSEVSDVTLN